MTPTPIEVPVEVIFTEVNNWVGVFAPIMAIGVGISLALAALSYVGKVIAAYEMRDLNRRLGIAKPKPSSEPKQDERNERVEQLARLFNLFLDHVAGEPIKRKNDDKPKRKNDDQPTFYIGDDGELIEVIEDKEERYGG